MDRTEFFKKLKSRYRTSNDEENYQKIADLKDDIEYKKNIDFYKLYKEINDSSTFNKIPGESILRELIYKCTSQDSKEYDFEIENDQGHYKCLECRGKGGKLKTRENGSQYFYRCGVCDGQGVAKIKDHNYWMNWMSYNDAQKIKQEIKGV